MTQEEQKQAQAELDTELDELKKLYPALRWRAMVVQDVLNQNKRNQSASLTVAAVTTADRSTLKTVLEAAGWTGECKGVAQWTVTRSKEVANG